MTPSELERFEAKYVPTSDCGCWLWDAAVNWAGYGVLMTGSRKTSRRMTLAHRLSYEHHVGPIPDGLCVLHRCDVPACVNPDHLWVGTQGDNMADKTRKGRGRAPGSPGEKNGRARLTEAVVREIRGRLVTEDCVGLSGRLAREYGVGRSTIVDIKYRKRWVHI